MNKEKFRRYLLEECYQFCKKPVFEEILDNILDYAGNMGEIEQYNFLCDMLPNVPEIKIRDTYFSNEETEMEY